MSGARLTMLTVVQETDTGSIDGAGLNTLEGVLQDTARAAGESRVEEILAEFEGAAVPVATEVVSGSPHRATRDYVDATSVDFVALGASEGDSLAERVFGSTTERVARRCDVPVTVV